jgi:serine/threonine protein kinase
MSDTANFHLRGLESLLAELARGDPASWADRLREDQCSRWRAGQRVRVEDYLKRLPALAEHPDALLDLIYAEVLLRERIGGERVQLEELQQRFPDHREALARQWEVHQVIESEGPGPPGDAIMESGPNGRSLPETGGGSPIAGYDIVEELGRGGNGMVYLARQRSLNRLVAIKMIKPDRLLSAQRVARLHGEAELLARLQHPHIVAIHRVGLCKDQPYLVLEYVPGGSLAQRMNGQPWPAAAAIALVETLARTLAVVHEQGIVHRDLKPANVLLAKKWNADDADDASSAFYFFPKIVDFGLAKALDESMEPGVTQTGDLVGTPRYMAPEQATGKRDRIGPATDQHALGMLLYELLTDRPPFVAENGFDMLTQVAFTEPLPPSRLVRGISASSVAVGTSTAS